jgi:hypothetical protein
LGKDETKSQEYLNIILDGLKENINLEQIEGSADYTLRFALSGFKLGFKDGLPSNCIERLKIEGLEEDAEYNRKYLEYLFQIGCQYVVQSQHEPKIDQIKIYPDDNPHNLGDYIKSVDLHPGKNILYTTLSHTVDNTTRESIIQSSHHSMTSNSTHDEALVALVAGMKSINCEHYNIQVGGNATMDDLLITAKAFLQNDMNLDPATQATVLTAMNAKRPENAEEFKDFNAAKAALLAQTKNTGDGHVGDRKGPPPPPDVPL